MDITPDAIVTSEPQEILIEGPQTYGTITDKIASIPLEQKPPIQWWRTAGFVNICLFSLLVSVCYLLYKGVGTFGINQPVGWGFDIINFVWWIGIGHAGTL